MFSERIKKDVRVVGLFFAGVGSLSPTAKEKIRIFPYLLQSN
jgi:hypothetical protein